jgi:hypothetical protein
VGEVASVSERVRGQTAGNLCDAPLSRPFSRYRVRTVDLSLKGRGEEFRKREKGLIN